MQKGHFILKRRKWVEKPARFLPVAFMKSMYYNVHEQADESKKRLVSKLTEEVFWISDVSEMC